MKFVPIQSALLGIGVAALLSTHTDASPKFVNITATGSSGEPPAQQIADTLHDGSLAYIDRTHTYKGIPSQLADADYLQMRNVDKSSANYSLSFDLLSSGALYLFIDNRIGDGIGGTNPQAGTDDGPKLGNGVMDWVLAMGFVDTGLDIGVDENNDGSINNTSSIFAKVVEAGHFTFGAQNDTTIDGPGGRNMYAIACAPVPEPSTFALLGLAGAGLLMFRRKKS